MGKQILIVGGTFSELKNEDGTYGKPSSLINKLATTMTQHPKILSNKDNIDIFNGGAYESLAKIANSTPLYNIVLWMPNVENNDLPKIRNIKEIAPKVMLVTSKRNDNNKYSFQELIQRALALKSNLVIEFSKTKNNLFDMHIFDPLGCAWYQGDSINAAVDALINRLYYLDDITRQATIQTTDDKSLVLNWYFDRFKQNMFESDKTVDIPNEKKFIGLVHKYANEFHKLMNPGTHIKRFLGNCSLKQPPQVGRCSKGMPSFKSNNYVFISKRNVNKETIELDSFAPCYLENNQVFYCGEDKPSVDAPIQLRLYEALPQIRYMIHSHCYIKGAPFTSTSIPCGAIEEVDEIMTLIKHINPELDATNYTINLIGHGSLVMASSTDELENIEYFGRTLPEKMY